MGVRFSIAERIHAVFEYVQEMLEGSFPKKETLYSIEKHVKL